MIPPAVPRRSFSFVISVFLLYPPIKNIGRLNSHIEAARVIGERIDELLKTKTDVPEPANPKKLHAAGADIHFEHVSFNYGEKPVLRDLSLTVKAGTMVALVGRSGSGKTTLTNLLLRFYDPQQGRVLIGGTDIRDVTSNDLRAQMAVVTQEIILFNGTVRRNIELGRIGATDAEIEAAPATPTRMSSSSINPAATRHPSASAAPVSLAASASAWRSRAPSCATRPS